MSAKDASDIGIAVNNSFLFELIMEVSRDRLFTNLFLIVIVILVGCSFVEVSGNCGSHLTSSSGFIQSPNYPGPYPAGQQCTWTVSVDGSVENIRISFSSFKLRPSVDGQCVDYVEIYSLLLNEDEDAVMEEKFCGHSIPLSIKIAQASMTVRFFSEVSVSDSNTGFSLRYQANFKDSSKVSQATAGIVAAIFCAVVFIGVGMLRCIMMGACNVCNASNRQNNRRDRQVMGTSESYAFQADFPPSYSTVMHHPERFPTPENSPQVLTRWNGTAGATHSPSMDQHEGTFTVHSSSNESSDDDDEDTPPPPYPGYVSSEDDINLDFASNDTNATNRATDIGSDNDEVVTNEIEMDAFQEVPSLATVMDNEQIPSVAGAPELPVDLPISSRPDHGETDLRMSRGEEVELSQTCVLQDDNTEEVVIV